MMAYSLLNSSMFYQDAHQLCINFAGTNPGIAFETISDQIAANHVHWPWPSMKFVVLVLIM